MTKKAVSYPCKRLMVCSGEGILSRPGSVKKEPLKQALGPSEEESLVCSLLLQQHIQAWTLINVRGPGGSSSHSAYFEELVAVSAIPDGVTAGGSTVSVEVDLWQMAPYQMSWW